MPDMIIAITLLLLSSAAHPLKQLRHFDKILGQIVNTHLHLERQYVLLGLVSVERTWIGLVTREEDLQYAAVDLIDHPHQRYVGDPGSGHQPA